MKIWNAALIPLLSLAVVTASAQTEPPVTVSPDSVNLNFQIGGLNNQGAQQAVTLSTTGAAALSYDFGLPSVNPNPGGCEWIAVSPASGAIPAESSAQSTITYNCPTGLPPGSYSGSLPVGVTGGSLSTASIPVNLLVSNSPLLFLSTGALNFGYELGTNPPVAQSVTPQSTAVAASSTTGQIPITASASTASGGPWLSVSPAGVFTTGSPISVSVSPANLLPGIYMGTVTFAPAAGATAGNGAQTIQVTLTVANDAAIQASGVYGAYSGPIPPPSLVPLTSLSFPYQIGQAAPAIQGVVLYSSTGDQLNYSVTSAEASCGSATWLALGGNTSGVTSGQPMEFTVAVQNLGSLPVGVCTGSITVNAVNPATGNAAVGSPLSIPVTLYVSDNPLLSVYAPFLGFTLPVGGSAATYNIGVNSTNPSVNFALTASETTSSGGNWLTASVSGSDQGQLVSISANPGSLPAGTYNGTVTITAPGSEAANSPLIIPVTLYLTPGAMVFSTSSLAFTYIAGGSNPVAQSVQVTANVSANFQFSAVANSGTTDNWLSVTPASGVGAVSFTVNVSGAGLSPGTYDGTVVVTSPNASNSPYVIPVTLLVYAGAILASPSPSAGLTFTQAAGGGSPPAQTVTISKTPGSLTLGAATSTASGGNWLSFSTIAGSSASTLQLQVTVNAGNLEAGTYSGGVTITAPGASGSPIIYPVTLIVTSALVISASPAALSFGYTLNAPAPAAQIVQVSPEFTALRRNSTGLAEWAVFSGRI